jgi:hypothetical protein
MRCIFFRNTPPQEAEGEGTEGHQETEDGNKKQTKSSFTGE